MGRRRRRWYSRGHVGDPRRERFGERRDLASELFPALHLPGLHRGQVGPKLLPQEALPVQPLLPREALPARRLGGNLALPFDGGPLQPRHLLPRRRQRFRRRLPLRRVPRRNRLAGRRLFPRTRQLLRGPPGILRGPRGPRRFLRGPRRPRGPLRGFHPGPLRCFRPGPLRIRPGPLRLGRRARLPDGHPGEHPLRVLGPAQRPSEGGPLLPALLAHALEHLPRLLALGPGLFQQAPGDAVHLLHRVLGLADAAVQRRLQPPDLLRAPAPLALRGRAAGPAGLQLRAQPLHFLRRAARHILRCRRGRPGVARRRRQPRLQLGDAIPVPAVPLLQLFQGRLVAPQLVPLPGLALLPRRLRRLQRLLARCDLLVQPRHPPPQLFLRGSRALRPLPSLSSGRLGGLQPCASFARLTLQLRHTLRRRGQLGGQLRDLGGRTRRGRGTAARLLQLVPRFVEFAPGRLQLLLGPPQLTLSRLALLRRDPQPIRERLGLPPRALHLGLPLGHSLPRRRQLRLPVRRRLPRRHQLRLPPRSNPPRLRQLLILLHRSLARGDQLRLPVHRSLPRGRQLRILLRPGLPRGRQPLLLKPLRLRGPLPVVLPGAFELGDAPQGGLHLRLQLGDAPQGRLPLRLQPGDALQGRHPLPFQLGLPPRRLPLQPRQLLSVAVLQGADPVLQHDHLFPLRLRLGEFSFKSLPLRGVALLQLGDRGGVARLLLPLPLPFQLGEARFGVGRGFPAPAAQRLLVLRRQHRQPGFVHGQQLLLLRDPPLAQALDLALQQTNALFDLLRVRPAGQMLSGQLQLAAQRFQPATERGSLLLGSRGPLGQVLGGALLLLPLRDDLFQLALQLPDALLEVALPPLERHARLQHGAPHGGQLPSQRFVAAVQLSPLLVDRVVQLGDPRVGGLLGQVQALDGAAQQCGQQAADVLPRLVRQRPALPCEERVGVAQQQVAQREHVGRPVWLGAADLFPDHADQPLDAWLLVALIALGQHLHLCTDRVRQPPAQFVPLLAHLPQLPAEGIDLGGGRVDARPGGDGGHGGGLARRAAGSRREPLDQLIEQHELLDAVDRQRRGDGLRPAGVDPLEVPLDAVAGVLDAPGGRARQPFQFHTQPLPGHVVQRISLEPQELAELRPVRRVVLREIIVGLESAYGLVFSADPAGDDHELGSVLDPGFGDEGHGHGRHGAHASRCPPLPASPGSGDQRHHPRRDVDHEVVAPLRGEGVRCERRLDERAGDGMLVEEGLHRGVDALAGHGARGDAALPRDEPAQVGGVKHCIRKPAGADEQQRRQRPALPGPHQRVVFPGPDHGGC